MEICYDESFWEEFEILMYDRDRMENTEEDVKNIISLLEVKKDSKLEQAEILSNTFEKLAQKWLIHRKGTLSDRTLDMIQRRFERDVFPTLGATPLADLTPKLILENVLLPIENRGAVDLVHRIRSAISQVLRYGVANGACERDLTFDLRGALKPIKHKHHAAFDSENGTTDPIKIGALLRAIDGYSGSFVVKCALRIHPYVATRPGELRHAEWQEIDFENKLWSIPSGRMKMKKPHIVPLSDHVLNVLFELKEISGGGKYLFPSVRSTAKPISDNAMNSALRRMGFTKEEFVSHGWRAVFRTLADEVLQERPDIIEAQLAHQVKDALGRAYNRTSFLKERCELMDRWGGYLEGLQSEVKVIPIHNNGTEGE
ncbi:MAG: site-specific integrase [Bacteroidales bacterium]|jgi:integrase|nr:site-specific integrase [Bacteroidales bacterium]